MKIDRIEISGFKSITHLVLEDISPYSVFAGPNGSGKSNLMDVLEFVSAVIRWGAVEAIRKFRGFQQIHCYKLAKEDARNFELKINLNINNDNKLLYSAKIINMENNPIFFEALSLKYKDKDEYKEIFYTEPMDVLMGKEKLSVVTYIENHPYTNNWLGVPDDFSKLLLFPDYKEMRNFFANIKIFRFDPIKAKESNGSSNDVTELNFHGSNLAAMLSVLEKKDDICDEIMDWITLIVPGMEKVSTTPERLSGGTLLEFKEEGIEKTFPAYLISDGTIYALCIMTAIFSRISKPGITIIEEPERGLHPNAIGELVNLMRDKASPEHSIFVTTHSESLVRASKANELWVVNKKDGQTVAKNVGKIGVDLGRMNLDKAWLMNFFDGGLPW